MHPELLLPVAISLLVTTGILLPLIPYLKKLGADQTIREDGPVWHNQKGKTPTMGGVAFLGGISAAVLVLLPSLPAAVRNEALIALLCALSFGFIGFVDDYIKVVRRRNLGLTPRQKLLLQVLAATAFLASRYAGGDTAHTLLIPLLRVSLPLGVFYYPAAAFIIVGTVNSVNLTDGLDGLATLVTLPVSLLFMAIAYRYQNAALWLVSAALLGGLLGYLPFNLPKAKVFMGDTGAFFLGGCVAALAFMCSMPVLLALCGIVYVLETCSDLLQILYFRHTGGKRLFKMAPLHHHYEMKGLSEKQVDVLFTLISAAGCLLAYLAYTDFF
ncbi:MAG: phospho-N-acetylmuramoyl-pentapeptide-transferase [Clostridiales bacterium]|nr:phospho-N-acetylmuramoyl-pentapeptide-transferase [Clostridiales bacterium]